MKPIVFLADFSAREDGAIAALFGLSACALLLTMGVAVDYSRTFSVQSALQNDLDAAMLGGAAQADELSQIEGIAQQYFTANWTAKYKTSTVLVSVTNSGEKRIRGTATTTLPTTLMKLGGFDELNITVASEVELANQNVEVALVLDTTASMSGSKLTALETAAKTLVQTAYSKPDADQHVKIGLVPFAQYVNVGMNNRNASWMNVPLDSSVAKDGCGYVSPVIATTNCRMETFTGNNDGVPYTYQSEVCDYEYGPPEYKCTPYTETKTWYGCAGPRDTPLDTLDEQYSSRIPGTMNATCSSPLAPLTNDESELNDSIDAMTAVGETYIPTGLMWGWRLLSKDAPFEEAAGYDEKVDGLKVRKILVLMTDGVNTKSPIYPAVAPDAPTHDGSDATLANTLTAQICTNIKGKGITIYSVAFDVADEPVKDILRACASDPGKFFDAPEPAQLEAAFSDIGNDLAPLRIVQ